MENAVHHYLRDAKGYQADAYNLAVAFQRDAALFGQDVYAIAVTFRDETDAIYPYGYTNTKTYQKGVAPINGQIDKAFKHAETE